MNKDERQGIVERGISNFLRETKDLTPLEYGSFLLRLKKKVEFLVVDFLNSEATLLAKVPQDLLDSLMSTPKIKQIKKWVPKKGEKVMRYSSKRAGSKPFKFGGYVATVKEIIPHPEARNCTLVSFEESDDCITDVRNIFPYDPSLLPTEEAIVDFQINDLVYAKVKGKRNSYWTRAVVVSKNEEAFALRPLGGGFNKNFFNVSRKRAGLCLRLDKPTENLRPYKTSSTTKTTQF